MQRRPLGPDTFCGDMSFVPAEGADGSSQDDNGHLLVLTHNTRTETSEMLVLDARARLRHPRRLLGARGWREKRPRRY